MANKGGCTVSALPVGEQWVQADNLMLRDGALHSRPGIAPVSPTVTLGERVLTVSREVMPVTDETGVCRSRRTVCFMQAGEKYATVRTGALYSDGSFQEDDAASVVMAPDTTVMCVPCAMDTATDTLLFTGNGEIMSAGGGVLVSEQSNVRVPVVWSAGRGAATLSDARPDEGHMQEAPNLLTSQFEARYTADATGCVFYLPFAAIDDSVFTVSVYDAAGARRQYTVGAGKTAGEADTEGVSLHVDRAVGRFWLVKGGVPVPPATGGRDNVRARGRKAALTRDGLVYGCTFGSWFGEPGAVADGGRLFVSGNPRQPNAVCCSAVGDPFYFPDNTVYALGRSREAVTAFARQGNALIVFKEHALFGVAYGSVDKSGFPIACLHEQVGCDCPHSVVSVNGKLTWLTGEGAVWRLKSVDGENRCTLLCLSEGFAPTLAATLPASRREAVGCEIDGHYFVAVGACGFWLDESDGYVWYRWRWTDACHVVAASSRTGQTGLLMSDRAGHLRGCRLEGDTDGLPVLGIPVEVAADTGLLFENALVRRRVLQLLLRLDGQAEMTPYDERGDGRTVAVSGTYDRLPVRSAGGRRFGLRLTARAPFTLYQGRLFSRP